MIDDRFHGGVLASPACQAVLAADRRPSTPSSPVQIPVRTTGHETAHPQKPHHRYRSHDGWRTARLQSSQTPLDACRWRDMHSPDSIPPSVAALLAVTNIPPPRGPRALRRSRGMRDGRDVLDSLGSMGSMGSLDSLDSLDGIDDEKPRTVDAFIDRVQGADQELSLSLSKSPLDVLLTPPDELEDDQGSVSDSVLDSVLSTRAVSLESMPSLSDSVGTGTVSSVDTRCAPRQPAGAGRRARPKHRSLTPLSSPTGKNEAHPLSWSDDDDASDKLDFRVFHSPPDPLAKTTEARFPLQPLRSAFKSNLTASLRALRNAARSFSNLNLTSIPPEDFLTRSILTIDPHIPYTDERRPPPLEEEPSPALRRYLNPTTCARIDPPQILSPALASASLGPLPAPTATVSSGAGSASSAAAPADRPTFTASIQMHTYKVHRGRQASSATSSRTALPPTTAGGPTLGADNRPLLATDDRPPPGPRQRELRENSDFIRIAVMEMAMRRMGKLDDRRPGRARLALPPRKASGRPYVVGADGTPARWVGITADSL